MSIKEHLLFGNEEYGTVRTACGLRVERRDGTFFVGKHGLNQAHWEADYKRMKSKGYRVCAGCEKSYSKVLRGRLR